MITLMQMRITTISLTSPFNRIIRRMAVINSNGSNTLMLIRRLFRPRSKLNIRIINKLIRRRRIQNLGRRLTRNRATTLTAKTRISQNIQVKTLRNIRHLLGLKIRIPTINNISLNLRLTRFFRRNIRINIQINRFFTSLIRSNSLLNGQTRHRLSILTRNLNIVRQQFLLRSTSNRTQNRANFTITRNLRSNRSLRRNKLARTIQTRSTSLHTKRRTRNRIVRGRTITMELTNLSRLGCRFYRVDILSYLVITVSAFYQT